MDGTSDMCHQCQRNDKGRVVRCLGCKTYRRRYSVPCITRWYPHLTEDDFVNSCPFCRNNCNRKTCLRTNIIKKMVEKSVEATIRGIDACEVKVPQADYKENERIYWTSLVDFHRSCNKCSYDLCPSCCRELRRGLTPGGAAASDIVLRQHGVEGKEDLQHGSSHDNVASQKPSDGQNDVLMNSAVLVKDMEVVMIMFQVKNLLMDRMTC